MSPGYKSPGYILKRCLQQAQIETTVNEVVGDYNSPTLVVNGFDVTGHAASSSIGQILRRLDLADEGKILAALRVISLFDNHDPSEKAILSKSLQLLFASGKPVGLSKIRESANLPKQSGSAIWFTSRLYQEMKF